jgi:hypothetical protein
MPAGSLVRFGTPAESGFDSAALRKGRKTGMTLIERPQTSEYGESYRGYVWRVPETDILSVLEAQPGEMRAIAASVPEERETFRYEPGKWSLRQVLGHVTDSERVFGYRLFCVARGETQSLPGFDEFAYASIARHDEIPLARLAEQFAAARAAILDVARDLDTAAWARSGVANQQPVTARAIAYIMAGHVRHHLHVLHERYGIAAAAGASRS